MPSYLVRTVAACLLAGLLAPALARSLVSEHRGSFRTKADVAAFHSEVRNAMAEALGCGGHVGEEELAAIERHLVPLWRVLPKIAEGRIERRSLRYLVHRYFSKTSSLVVRGFEPSRPVSESGWGTADILSQRVPGYVERVLESRHAQSQGFDLQDAVHMVAAIEQLIIDSDSTLLEKVYREHSKLTSLSISISDMGLVLEEYLVHWMMGDDPEGINTLLMNRTFLEEAFPHWDHVSGLARGEVKSLEFQRQRQPKAARSQGQNALALQYTFDDTHRAVGHFTKSFGSFWDSECKSLKSALIKMDTHHIGRVPLSQFYSSALDSDWRFGESESYLRELGALDETSSWHGKQVIIPNYLQAASNCIVSTPHYLVCCTNDCYGLLAEIEEAVGAPTASPGAILALVANTTSQTTIDHDEHPVLTSSLKQQLEQIAAVNGGTVPLHGRLFAQWLHYVFPRECPFPHLQGTAVTVTPTEYGNAYLATSEEMQMHASSYNETNNTIDKFDQQWMSQWSSEEELLVDYAKEMRTPWELGLAGFGAVLAFMGVLAGATSNRKLSCSAESLLPTHQKAHFV